MAFAIDSMESAMSQMDKSEQYGSSKPAVDNVLGNSAPEMDEKVALSLTQNCLDMSRSHVDAGIRRRWTDAYRAFQNEHMSGSKYDTPGWRGRSRHFKPKTRAAVRGSMSAASAALFSSVDAVKISATNEGDKLSRARAAIRHELVNYRLDRSSGIAGMNWFMEAMGALQDARITGLCISKQFWQFEERKVGTEKVEKVEEQIDLESGTVIEVGTGEFETVPIYKAVKNRPMIRTYPVDQVHRDPGAHWTEQAQEGSFIILENPMTVGDVIAMMGNDTRTGVQWREVSRSQIVNVARHPTGNEERSAVRRSREGQTGRDRYDEASSSAVDEFATVWVHENFIRYDGQEWHYWSLGSEVLLSDPIPLEEAYPEQYGARPIVIGINSVESHKIDPLSMVDQMAPLQRETNDITNLTLDAVKQGVNPVTLVKRNKNINAKALQNRTADAVVYVSETDDVAELGRPGPGQAAFAMADRLTVDIDELSGSFSSGSVMSNRSLNETVGGMSMLRTGAQLVADFDLKCWVETWVEPVLRQFCNLEGYYENDATVLAICGEKAKLRERYGINHIDDQLIEGEVVCRVDISGGTDPMQKLQKMGYGIEMIMKLMGERVAMRIKDDELIAEVFSLVGYRDGDRFFESMEDQDPRVMQLMQTLEQMKAQLESKDKEIQSKVQIASINAQTDIKEQELENQGRIEELLIKLQGEIAKQRESQQAAAEQADTGFRNQTAMKFFDTVTTPQKGT